MLRVRWHSSDVISGIKLRFLMQWVSCFSHVIGSDVDVFRFGGVFMFLSSLDIHIFLIGVKV